MALYVNDDKLSTLEVALRGEIERARATIDSLYVAGANAIIDDFYDQLDSYAEHLTEVRRLLAATVERIEADR